MTEVIAEQPGYTGSVKDESLTTNATLVPTSNLPPFHQIVPLPHLHLPAHHRHLHQGRGVHQPPPVLHAATEKWSPHCAV